MNKRDNDPRRFLMKNTSGIRFLSATVLSALLMTSCGGGDGGDSVEVTQISVDRSFLTVGDRSVINVEFSFSSDDVFNHDRTAYVVVKLPREVSFQLGSAEIQRPFDDNRVSPQINTCSDGTTYLSFAFDDRDLIDARNPGGDGDAQVNFTVRANSRGSGVIISGEASESPIATRCGTSLSDEQAIAAVDVR